MALRIGRFLEVTLQRAPPADIAGEAVESSGEDEVGLPEREGNRLESPIFELHDESNLYRRTGEMSIARSPTGGEIAGFT